jgi:6-phosphofructokinase 1
MNFQFHRYALPLIQGEVAVPFDGGLPSFAKLTKATTDKLLPAYEV